MLSLRVSLVTAALLIFADCLPALCQATAEAAARGVAIAPPAEPETAPRSLAMVRSAEPEANTLQTPQQILRTGIDINAVQLSANSKQLADALKLTPLLQKIAQLRTTVRFAGEATVETLAARQRLSMAIDEAQQIIQEANLSVDFTVAAITAEQSVYQELLATYQAEANRAMQWSNWAAYYSNGALWATAEALDIPTWKRPKYSIASGINGIIAGVIPSIASLYAMHVSGGKKHPADQNPNMLAQVFNLKPDLEDEYPRQVWDYLTAVPAGEKKGKTRRDILIDRWVADKNIAGFTDRNSKDQIELLTGVSAGKKGLTIDLLQTRQTMLAQLAAEVMKMKRPLFELSMAVHGEKQL